MMRGYVRRRRSRLEIKIEVLKACLEPNLPTRMMYEAKISWMTFCDVLKELRENGLIEFHERKTRLHGERNRRILGLYEISEKGKSVLQRFKAFKKDLVG